MTVSGFFLVALLFLFSSVGVGAHSWYEEACCSGKDCHPVEDYDVAHNNDGSYTYKPLGLVFSRERVRASRDGKYHVCVHEWGGEDGQVQYRPICIYIPVLF